MPTPGNKSQLALAELFEQEASYNLVHIRKRIQFFVLFAWIWIAVTVLGVVLLLRVELGES